MCVMKIQSINSQNNISYRAYFKENTLFKKVLEQDFKRGWTGDLTYEAKRFKSMLPNHELEILNIDPSKYEQSNTGSFTVINNMTKKVKEFTYQSYRSQCEPCIKFIMNIIRNDDDCEYFFDETDSYEKALYNDLTTPGETIENIICLRQKKK